jgi:hypothetical protein
LCRLVLCRIVDGFSVTERVGRRRIVMSEDLGTTRRSLHRELDQNRLRWELLQRYAKNRRYQQIVAKQLRPRWEAIEGAREIPNADSFEYLAAQIEGRLSHLRPVQPLLLEQLTDYIGTVRQTVATELRLTWQGLAAEWAAEYIHMDVTDPEALESPEAIFGYVADPRENLIIKLRVSPTEVRFTPLQLEPAEWYVDIFPDLRRQDDDEDQQVYRLGDVSVSLGPNEAEWKSLAQKAHDFLDEGIADLRDWWDRESRAHNPTKYGTESKYLDALVTYLFPPYASSTPPVLGKNLEQRLRELARFIEIDFPAPRPRR